VDTALSRRRVLVTDWVDGLSFEEVAEQPDPVRDRFAEIVYRFFYVTAAELQVALGDPHPGNYLLCEDGRVAFFDFGMVRELPPEYLRREARVFAAIRESDSQALLAGLRELGYLPGLSAEWDGELLLEQMRAAAWWLTGDQQLRLAPEDVWRGSESLRDGSGDQMMEQMRRMTLPPEALLLRRMEGLLFQIAATLRAEAPWGPLLRELIEGGPPVGELGREQAEWLGSRAQRSRR
jgi:ABC1 atypical kinase-like domain